MIKDTDSKIMDVVYFGILSKYDYNIFHPVVIFVHRLQVLYYAINNENTDTPNISQVLDDVCHCAMQELTESCRTDIISCWDLCRTIIMSRMWRTLRVSTYR